MDGDGRVDSIEILEYLFKQEITISHELITLEASEVIIAYGHENVQATHRSTLEITKESHLSKQGDCIIAVSASKGLAELSDTFKEALRKHGSKLTIVIEAGGVSDVINAFGSPLLILSHPTEMVVRKSSYVCRRTLAIQADKAACDLSKALVEKLKTPGEEVRITLTVRV